jgi:succinoglycan biosynthesis transport protein ExoP
VTIGYHDFYRQRKNPPALSDFFAEEIDDVRAGLDNWRMKRQQFMDESKFYGSTETSRFLLNRMTGLEERLSTLNGDISSQEMRTDSFGKLVDKSGLELETELTFSLSQYVLQGGILQNIKFALQNLNLKRDELIQKYTDQHPEVIAVNEQIARLHADLKQQVQNAYNIELASLQELKARRSQVLEELNSVRAELEAMPDKERQLSEIDAMIKKLEERYALMQQRQGESEIAQAGHTDWDVVVLANASAPYSKKTQDYVRLAIGPLLSLIVGFGIAFFMESMDHSVKNAAEAEEYLDAPVLVTISDLAARRRKTVGHDV